MNFYCCNTNVIYFVRTYRRHCPVTDQLIFFFFFLSNRTRVVFFLLLLSFYSFWFFSRVGCCKHAATVLSRRPRVFCFVFSVFRVKYPNHRPATYRKRFPTPPLGNARPDRHQTGAVSAGSGD